MILFFASLRYLLLACFIPLSSFAITNQAIELPQEIKATFWKRLNSKYKKYFKRDLILSKDEKISTWIKKEDNLSFLIAFQRNEVKTSRMLRVYTHMSKNTNDCSISNFFLPLMIESCQGAQQNWQESPCPKNLVFSNEAFQYDSNDRCYQSKGYKLLITKKYRNQFFHRFWPEIYNFFSKEFIFFPSGIIWSEEKNSLEVIYF